MPYVHVDIDLDEIDTDDLVDELTKRIESERTTKKPSEKDRKRLKESFSEIIKAIGVSPMKKLEIKTLDDKIKYEHILKVFSKYSSSDFETKLPE